MSNRASLATLTVLSLLLIAAPQTEASSSYFMPWSTQTYTQPSTSTYIQPTSFTWPNFYYTSPTTTSAPLTIKKTGPEWVNKGDPLIYTITVKNSGSTAAQKVTVTDTPPSGLVFDPALSTPGCVLSGGVIKCAETQVPAYGTVTYTIAFKTNAITSCPKSVDNSAKVSMPKSGGSIWSATAKASSVTIKCSVVVEKPNLTVDKSGPATITAGGKATYTIQVKNTSTVAAQDVVLTDFFSIPVGYTFLAGESTGGCVQITNEPRVQCNIGTVNAGQTLNFTLVFQTTANVHCGNNLENQADLAWRDGGFAWDKHMAAVQCQQVPQCKDGIDNDYDGKKDYPYDPGCSDANDNDEKDVPQCRDGKDNDGDWKKDYPYDPGCSSPDDNDERDNISGHDDDDDDGGDDDDDDGGHDDDDDGGHDDDDDGGDDDDDDGSYALPACRDGKDNDGDWKKDYPYDPGCSSPDDNDEKDVQQAGYWWWGRRW